MGTQLDFYVLAENFNLDFAMSDRAGYHTRSIGHETRLCIPWKHYPMHERIYDLDSFVDNDKLHVDGEPVLGYAPAGDVARVLIKLPTRERCGISG